MIDYSPVMEMPFEYSLNGTVQDIARSKEKAIESYLGLSNLIMNFELHEFEAYLYSNPLAFVKYGKKAQETISKIVEKAGGPEYINTSFDNMPSRRLNHIIPNYTKSKKIHTSALLENLTLAQIRSECEHLING